jgi:hypothetical protein
LLTTFGGEFFLPELPPPRAVFRRACCYHGMNYCGKIVA